MGKSDTLQRSRDPDDYGFVSLPDLRCVQETLAAAERLLRHSGAASRGFLKRVQAAVETCGRLLDARNVGGGPVAMRACVRCGKDFLSEGRGNHVCRRCCRLNEACTEAHNVRHTAAFHRPGSPHTTLE